VLHGLLMTRRVLHARKRMSRLIGVLPRVRMMSLFTILSGIAMTLSKVKAMRCDAGYQS
jgi:hypothetical protein